MSDALKDRTKKFTLRVIRMTEALARNRVADVLGGQVLRSGTSVGANYRAACLMKEADELLRIVIASSKTALRNSNPQSVAAVAQTARARQ